MPYYSRKKRSSARCQQCQRFVQSVGSISLCDSCKPQRSETEHADGVADHRVELDSVAAENELVLDGVECEECQNCWRSDTPSLPLTLVCIAGAELQSRQYGYLREIRSNRPEAFTLCLQCAEYLRRKSKGQWKDAWPSVLWSLAFLRIDAECEASTPEEHWRLIPDTLRIQWEARAMYLEGYSHVSLKEIPVCLVDKTVEIKRLRELSEFTDLVHVRNLLENDPIPTVMCVCGAQEYSTDAKSIQFSHLIQAYIPEFSAFRSDAFRMVRGMRRDFIEPWTQHGYKVAGAVQICSGKGLLLLTCVDHGKGCGLQYLHMPKNPIRGSLPSPYSEQLGTVVLIPSVLQSLKPKYSSHTWQMNEVRGGYQGLSSWVVSERRKWSIASEIVADREALIYEQRKDLNAYFHSTIEQDPLSGPVAEELAVVRSAGDPEKLSSALYGSTTVGARESVDLLRDRKRELQGTQRSYGGRASNLNAVDASNVVQAREGSGTLPEYLNTLVIASPLSGRGPILPTIPRYSGFTPLLWLYVVSSIGVPDIWKAASLLAKNTVSKPRAQLLEYVTRSILKIPTKCRERLSDGIALQRLMLDIADATEDFGPDESYNSAVNLGRYYWSSPLVHCVYHDSRGIHLTAASVSNSTPSIGMRQWQDVRILMIVTDSSRTSVRRAAEIPESITIGDDVFGLCMVSTDDSRADDDWIRCNQNRWSAECLFKPGTENTYWYLMERRRRGKYLAPGRVEDELRRMRGIWNLLIYRRSCGGQADTLRLALLQYTGGQGVMYCAVHKSPLVAQHKRDKMRCCYNISGREDGHERCSKHAAWSCPEASCTAGICEKHGIYLLESEDARLGYYSVEADRSGVPEDEENSTGSEEDLSERSSRSDVTFAEASSEYFAEAESQWGSESSSSESDRSIDEMSSEIPYSNAGRCATFVEPTNNILHHVSGHILLNRHCNLLVRPGRAHESSIASKRFLQSVVSKASGESIPLLQPEGELFPSAYWHYNDDNLSISGALPSVLYDEEGITKRYGFAGIVAQIRARVRNGRLLASTDPRMLQFYFDAMTNLLLRRSHSRIVLHKGFCALHESCGQFEAKTLEHQLRFEQAESRRTVMELAADLAETDEPRVTYFLTLTPNQRLCPGLRKIFEALEASRLECSPEEYRAHVQGSLNLMLRAWVKTVKAVMHAIEKGGVLGCTVKVWWRFEFQNEAGNLPHVHSLIWTNESNSSMIVRERVSASLSHLFGEEAELTEFGLVEGYKDFESLIHTASRVQTHDCAKGKFRCMKRSRINGEGEWKCRFPQRPQSYAYGYEEIEVHHSPEALNILIETGLAGRIEGTEDVVYHELLRTGKHVYPAMKNEHFSPLNGPLFALLRGSMNLLICSTYFAARYLAKYAAGVEERSKLSFTASAATNEVQLSRSGEAHPESGFENVKVGPGGAGESDKQKHRREVTGKTISLSESCFVLEGYDYVYSDADYIHVNTNPPESRSGVVRQKKHGEFSEGDQPQGVTWRRSLALPEWRQFTRSQEVLAYDSARSEIHPDPITKFGLRPPELLYVDSLRLYTKWFTARSIPLRERRSADGRRLNSHEARVSIDVLESSWIDATGQEIRVQNRYLPRLIDYTTKRAEGDERAAHVLRRILSVLGSNEDARKRFVDNNSKRRVVVFSSPLPHFGHKFLIHLLYSLGRFETEVDLFSCGNLARSFRIAELVGDDETKRGEEIAGILRRYITEQLLYIPGGTRTFDRDVCNAKNCLTELLEENNIVYAATPLVLDRAISCRMYRECEEELKDTRGRLIEALSNMNIPGLPSEEDLRRASADEPLEWRPEIHRAEEQSMDSLRSQEVAMDSCVKHIDIYLSGSVAYQRGLLLCGPAGSGKTHVIAQAAAYGLSKGLHVLFTSLAAERSCALGGRHIHSVFKIPIHYTTTSAAAESAIGKLGATSTGLKFLECLDMIIFDEIGTIPVDILDVIDRILQYVHGSSGPYGGKIIFATGDHLQLPPIRKASIFTGTMLLTTFKPVVLVGEVRAATCKYLKRVLEIMRKTPPSSTEVDECKQLIQSHCRTLADWNMLEPDVLRVVGKKRAEEIAENDFITYERSRGRHAMILKAFDEFTVDNGVLWQEANENVRAEMSSRTRFAEELTLLDGGLLQFVANDSGRQFWNSQLCKVAEFPAFDGDAITVYVAPVSQRHVPEAVDVERLGWRRVKVYKQASPTERLAGGSGRRFQYPLRPYISCTIHKVIGDTLNKIASRISLTESDFTLWLKSQVYVLFSRVKRLRDVTLIGGMLENVNGIGALLTQVSIDSNYRSYVDNLSI